jgi:hypothetical protein
MVLTLMPRGQMRWLLFAHWQIVAPDRRCGQWLVLMAAAV